MGLKMLNIRKVSGWHFCFHALGSSSEEEGSCRGDAFPAMEAPATKPKINEVLRASEAERNLLRSSPSERHN